MNIQNPKGLIAFCAYLLLVVVLCGMFRSLLPSLLLLAWPFVGDMFDDWWWRP